MKDEHRTKADLINELIAIRQRAAKLKAVEGECRQMAEALQESEAKYRALVKQIPAITCTAALDEASTTLYVSPQIESLLGISQTEWPSLLSGIISNGE